jgi:hypothetical protein
LLVVFGGFLFIDIALSLSHGVLSITMLVLDWLAALPFATWQQSAPSVGVTCSPLAIPI